ncbi:MAG: glycosyltransferase family 4 protein [Hyphomicrobiaceae bacterium]
MLDVAFAIPGDLASATGGYGYARKVLDLLPEFGINGHHLALPGSFPTPSDDDLTLTRQLLEQLPASTPVLFDGLAYGALPPDFLAGLHSPVVALIHHPLALETGIEPLRKRQLLLSERNALRQAVAVIATSHLTGRVLSQEYDVASSKLTIAEPGTEPAIRSTGTGSPFTMLAVGSLIPRKGYTVLIDALRDMPEPTRDEATLDERTRDEPAWQLTIAGALEHDPAEVNRVREAIMASGKRGRITIAGRVSDRQLALLYAKADLFVMPSLYEGYGMVLAEALARGLPIVSTTGGAAAETVPDDAAIKVPPGDTPALRAALETVMQDDSRRATMAAAAWDAGRALPLWPTSVERIADVLKTSHKEHAS